jgi:hypothetical protein
LASGALCGRTAQLIVIESVSAAAAAWIMIESRIPMTMMPIAFWYRFIDLMQHTP